MSDAVQKLARHFFANVKWLKMSEAKRRVHVKLEYSPEYPDPIKVLAGQKVRVGREDEEYPGWKWCKGPDGREGWVPAELLSDAKAEATVLEDYSAQELSVREGEEVEVEDARHGWLRVRNANGERGWIPASHIEEDAVRPAD
jgi:SH3-like domain-containing protein